ISFRKNSRSQNFSCSLNMYLFHEGFPPTKLHNTKQTLRSARYYPSFLKLYRRRTSDAKAHEKQRHHSGYLLLQEGIPSKSVSGVPLRRLSIQIEPCRIFHPQKDILRKS